MISIILARILGGYLIIAALASIIKRQEMVAAINEGSRDTLSRYYGAAFTTLLGLTLVTLHTVWAPNFQGVITLIGWLTLIKGIALFVAYPKYMNLSRKLASSNGFVVACIVFGIVGVWLTWISFSVL